MCVSTWNLSISLVTHDTYLHALFQVAAALGRVDEVIEDIIVRLKAKDIYVCVNIVVVSDHG